MDWLGVVEGLLCTLAGADIRGSFLELSPLWYEFGFGVNFYMLNHNTNTFF